MPFWTRLRQIRYPILTPAIGRAYDVLLGTRICCVGCASKVWGTSWGQCRGSADGRFHAPMTGDSSPSPLPTQKERHPFSSCFVELVSHRFQARKWSPTSIDMFRLVSYSFPFAPFPATHVNANKVQGVPEDWSQGGEPSGQY